MLFFNFDPSSFFDPRVHDRFKWIVRNSFNIVNLYVCKAMEDLRINLRIILHFLIWKDVLS